MVRKLATLAIWVLLAAISWGVDYQYPHKYAENTAMSLTAIAIIYFVLGVALYEGFARRIREKKTRYAFRKTLSLLTIGLSFAAIVTIWVEDTQALTVAYGLIGAGVAISLQDFFKNFVGGIVLFFSGIYKVDDRVQIGESYGDIIDIGMFYTIILEIQEWVAGDQPTGRICVLPNSRVLNNAVHNYTKDHDFVWDEIFIPLKYGSDWQKAKKVILKIVNKETKDITATAEKQMKRLGKKYFLQEKAAEPDIYIKLTDNWISFYIRYVTNAKARRPMHNILMHKLLTELSKTKKVHIASQTLDIVGFPKG